jgi:hypothetical protein
MFGTRASKDLLERGETFAGRSLSGDMPRGEFLYVKWRIKQKPEIHEQKVDLRDPDLSGYFGARQTCAAKSSVGKIGCCPRTNVSKWGLLPAIKAAARCLSRRRCVRAESLPRRPFEALLSPNAYETV